MEVHDQGCIVKLNSWWIQEFQNHWCGPKAIEFFGSGNCFDASSYIPYMFYVRYKSKMTIVNFQRGRGGGGGGGGEGLVLDPPVSITALQA